MVQLNDFVRCPACGWVGNDQDAVEETNEQSRETRLACPECGFRLLGDSIDDVDYPNADEEAKANEERR